MVAEFEELSYEERLEKIYLPILEQRRERDLITIYKLANKMEVGNDKTITKRDKQS